MGEHLYREKKLTTLRKSWNIWKLNFQDLTDDRRKAARVIQSGEYKTIHLGGDTHERGDGITRDETKYKNTMKGSWTVPFRILIIKLQENR